MKNFNSSKRRARAGFTLVELIVVVLIIAAVAGLVIPAVAMVGRSTDMAASAHTQASLANNMQEFFVLQKRYSQGLDSLIDLGTTGTAAPSIYAPEGFDTTTNTLITALTSVNSDNQVSGPPRSGPDLYYALEMATISANQVRSLTRGGLDYVYDHQTYDPSATPPGEVNANNSGKYKRLLTSAATQNWALIVRPTADTTAAEQAAMTFLQRLTPAEVTGTIGSRVYTPEIGTRIAAFGIGPNSRLVPTTMMSAPVYPGADGKYYGRYIAYFKVFETGERAVLLGVSDSYGRLPDYTQQQFIESLPNGSRQG